MSQDSITTKDSVSIPLNIQHGILIKEAKDSKQLLALFAKGKETGLEAAVFTREMLETTNDKKIITETSSKNVKDIEFLGVLLFGPQSLIEDLTKNFKLFS